MATPNDVLELAIDELRRNYDKLCNDYDQSRVKLLALLGGEIALLGFLYSAGNLFIPKALYGKIFYAIGLSLLIMSIGTFFRALRPIQWPVPTEFKEVRRLEKIYKNKNVFLEYLKEEYLECLEKGIAKHEKKVFMLDGGATELFIGGTILLVLKFFGG